MWRESFAFKSFTELNFPAFDICRDVDRRRFDLIIADNVFEHLPYPHRAGRNVFQMLRPGGYFLNITPFLIRVHDVPIDCSRWTIDGMKYFLEDCGFDRETMIAESWGNRACIRANFRKWARVGWYSPMHNEPPYPVQIWVLARKPAN
jgi:SAM-dependent methyltransferase